MMQVVVTLNFSQHFMASAEERNKSPEDNDPTHATMKKSFEFIHKTYLIRKIVEFLRLVALRILTCIEAGAILILFLNFGLF